MKKKKVVHVFSTFDSESMLTPSVLDSVLLDKAFHQRSFQTRYLLPNWVGPARKTLLAKLAEKGLITKVDDCVVSWSDHGAALVRHLKDDAGRGEQNARCQRRRRGADRLKSVEKLKGKLIGVEVEFYPDNHRATENRNNHEFSDVVTDGSLRDSGLEVRRISWVQDNRIRGIAGMVLRGEVSDKCGLHVHVDVRDLNGTAIVQTMERIKRCFPWIRWMVPSRRRSGYQYVQWDGDGHYGAVNYAEHHGTLEFRMQASTLNADFIEKWALFCYHLTRKLLGNPVPATWPKFVAMFPLALHEWIMRVALYMETHNDHGDDTVNSGVEYISSDSDFEGSRDRYDDDDDDDDSCEDED